MKALIWISCILLGLFLADRLFLWLESRGWMYWRRKQGSPRSVGTALMEIHANLEPGKRHVIEELKRDDEEEDGEGGPQDPEKGNPG
jgi:hypothetical protein